MLPRTLQASAAVVALSCLVACGDDTETGSGGGGGGTSATTTSAAGPSSTTTASSGSTTTASTSTGAGGEGAGGSGGSAPIELTWTTCSYEPEAGVGAKCARPDVPLDWSDPDGPTIELFVKRVPARESPARGQLWLLQGGPGGTAYGLEGVYSEAYRDAAPDLDIYFIEHRGTGEATKLECEDFDGISFSTQPLPPESLEASVADCLDELDATWGDGLQFFSAPAAARDLGELIDAASDGGEVYVAAVSYGTRWAHRYLQQFPAQADGVIFDSSMDETTDFFLFSEGLDAAAHGILDECGTDPFCSEKLGADPWAKLNEVLDRVRDEGHCPTEEDLGVADYRALFGALAGIGAESAALLAPTLYRLDRCSPDDQEHLLELRDALVFPDSIAGDYSSGALHFNIVFSELPGSPPDDLAEVEAGLTVSNEQMLAYAAAWDQWPTYDPSPWLGETADTDVPIVILSGTYDANTPPWLSAAFGERFDGPAQTFVSITGGHHAAILNSPIEGGSHCGIELVSQFLSAPTEELDTSCASQVLPLDFEDVDFPGAADPWED